VAIYYVASEPQIPLHALWWFPKLCKVLIHRVTVLVQGANVVVWKLERGPDRLLGRTGITLLVGVSVWGQQPIEFPHNKHIAKGLECVDCHITVDSGAAAGIPSVRKCMLCHRLIATDKPQVKQLQRYAEEGREIPWVRINRFEPEAHVKFRHAPHIWAKVECKSCHGDVANMTVAEPAVQHSMGRCVACHRQRGASQDCAACHF